MSSVAIIATKPDLILPFIVKADSEEEAFATSWFVDTDDDCKCKWSDF